MSTIKKIGTEPGDKCNRDGCEGFIDIKQEDCTCSTCGSPPCNSCENSWLECSECGWDERDEEKEPTHNDGRPFNAEINLSVNLDSLQKEYESYAHDIFNNVLLSRVETTCSNMISRDWGADAAFNLALRSILEKKLNEKYPQVQEEAIDRLSNKILSFEFDKGSKYHESRILDAVGSIIDEKIDILINKKLDEAMPDIKDRAAKILASKLL